jgi:hypothetical protein
MIQETVFTRNWNRFFYNFPKYRVKFLLGDFYEKVGIDNIFEPTIWNGRLHQDTSNNGVGIVNFATKSLVV